MKREYNEEIDSLANYVIENDRIKEFGTNDILNMYSMLIYLQWKDYRKIRVFLEELLRNDKTEFMNLNQVLIASNATSRIDNIKVFLN